MKKYIISILVVLIIIVSISVSFYADEKQETLDHITLDFEEGIGLDFRGVQIKLIEWENDYVRIEPTEYYKMRIKNKDIPIVVDREKNAIIYNHEEVIFKDINVYLIQTWICLIQFNKYKDYIWNATSITSFRIYVPENSVRESKTSGLIKTKKE